MGDATRKFGRRKKNENGETTKLETHQKGQRGPAMARLGE